MAYQKTVWVDQDVENPRTYVMRDNGDDTVTLLDAFGTITELGTPVNAANMNHIEQGIADLETYVNTILTTLYPVGSLYIGTQSDCPLATLISGSQWQLVARDRALWGGNGSNANTTIEAGLPNITGSFDPKIYRASAPVGATNFTGAFSGSNSGKLSTPDGGGDLRDPTLPRTINFSASSFNSIYGRSSTVQPPAYRVNIWRRTA